VYSLVRSISHGDIESLCFVCVRKLQTKQHNFCFLYGVYRKIVGLILVSEKDFQLLVRDKC